LRCGAVSRRQFTREQALETLTAAEPEIRAQDFITKHSGAHPRSLVIVREATKRVPDHFRSQYRAVDSRAIAGMPGGLIARPNPKPVEVQSPGIVRYAFHCRGGVWHGFRALDIDRGQLARDSGRGVDLYPADINALPSRHEGSRKMVLQ
jgi:hypothetical protein